MHTSDSEKLVPAGYNSVMGSLVVELAVKQLNVRPVMELVILNLEATID